MFRASRILAHNVFHTYRLPYILTRPIDNFLSFNWKPSSNVARSRASQRYRMIRTLEPGGSYSECWIRLQHSHFSKTHPHTIRGGRTGDRRCKGGRLVLINVPSSRRYIT
ncbi:hypothetical protein G9A89_012857 [Geosiphon pyriformis]|nr:hypothetical protein G9A89_012857 [Geosiphon pyriformis]